MVAGGIARMFYHLLLRRIWPIAIHCSERDVLKRGQVNFDFTRCISMLDRRFYRHQMLSSLGRGDRKLWKFLAIWWILHLCYDIFMDFRVRNERIESF